MVEGGRGFAEALGIGSYKSAWTLLHKIRMAMRRTSPTTYDRIVWSRRGQASKVRGPKRKPKAKAAAATSP